VADDVIGRLHNGDSALVGIFNGGGGTDKPNHIINVGKNAQGEVYVYNPDNTPNYLTGHAATEHLRSHIGSGCVTQPIPTGRVARSPSDLRRLPSGNGHDAEPGRHTTGCALSSSNGVANQEMWQDRAARAAASDAPPARHRKRLQGPDELNQRVGLRRAGSIRTTRRSSLRHRFSFLPGSAI
jgi:hypothetical protein